MNEGDTYQTPSGPLTVTTVKPDHIIARLADGSLTAMARPKIDLKIMTGDYEPIHE